MITVKHTIASNLLFSVCSTNTDLGIIVTSTDSHGAVNAHIILFNNVCMTANRMLLSPFAYQPRNKKIWKTIHFFLLGIAAFWNIKSDFIYYIQQCCDLLLNVLHLFSFLMLWRFDLLFCTPPETWFFFFICTVFIAIFAFHFGALFWSMD